VAPAAIRWPDPPPPPGWKLLPGWKKYLPLPRWDKHPRLPLGHVAGPMYEGTGRIPAHIATAASVPGWPIISIAAGAALRAACAPGLDCLASSATLRGGGGARGVHGFAGPADGQTGDGNKW
jgi:hypothetical protein